VNDDELRRACDENVVAAFALIAPYPGLGGEQRSFGAVEAVHTGTDHAYYNPIFVIHPEATLADVDAAIAWIRSRGSQPSIQVHDELRGRFQSHLAAAGFEADEWATPGMALQPIPTSQPQSPPGLTIETFGGGRRSSRADQRRFEDWHVAFGSSARFRQLMPAAALANPDVIFAVGRDADGPASCSLAIRSERALGVYAVVTHDRARRRGFGTAVTWAVIDAGRRAWGSEVAVLQSSELGLGVYERMGFRTVCRYVEFDPPKPAVPD
jgi:GNAT superfamily N-acetyltransferase